MSIQVARPSCKRVEQRLRDLHIARVLTLSEPPVNRSQQFARLLRLTLGTPEAREACCCAEFPGLCLLLTRNRERVLEVRLRLRSIRLRRHQRDFPGSSVDVGFPPLFLG